MTKTHDRDCEDNDADEWGEVADDPWSEFFEQLDGEGWPRDRHEEIVGCAAEMFRAGLVRVLGACQDNPARCYVLLCRLAGMTYEQIGRRAYMSRQMSHKHIRAVAAVDPEIGTVIRRIGRRYEGGWPG